MAAVCATPRAGPSFLSLPELPVLSFVFYKNLHILGVFTLVAALVAALARSARASEAPDPWSARLAVAHGAALFLVLLGGFGMLARLQAGLPGWAGAKLLVWLVVGGLIALRKNPTAAAWGVVFVPLLAALAAWIGYAKPF